MGKLYPYSSYFAGIRGADTRGNTLFSAKKKRKNTVAAAAGYLKTHYTEKQPRIDVIEVSLKERDAEKSISPQILHINHIRNAFDSKGRKH